MSFHRSLRPLVSVLAVLLSISVANAQVVNSEWNVGNGNWNVPTNWFPNDVPDNGGGFTYDVEIGNRPVAAGAQVTFVPEDDTADAINTLIVSGGADFFTNGNQLNVNGLTTITGASSTIRVDVHATPTTPSLILANLDLAAGGALVMSGGVANVSADLDINSTSVLSGHGTLNVGDLDATVEQAFQNSGLIQVAGNVSMPTTLTISAVGADTIDLDGDNEQGVVDVSNAVADVEADTLTLVIDGPLADGFGAVAAGATLQIGQRDTVTFNDNFEIDAGATITMDGGNNVATLNGPGAITDIADADFTITGDAVIDNNMTFSGTANTITLNANSSLELGGAVTIPDASALTIASSSAELIVSGSLVVNEAAGNFNWDGPGTATTTIEGTGLLSLIVNFIDTADNTYGGTLNLNDGGDVTVNNAINSWQAAGTVNKNGAGTSSVNGDEFAVTGDLNVNAGTLDVNADSIFGSTSDVNIANGATALMATTQIFNGADVTVNGTLSLGLSSIIEAPASLAGTGLFRLNSSSTVTANAVVNTTSFDWDGIGSGTLHTINDGVTFTINSTIWDADDAGDVDDPINLGGNGAAIVVNNAPSWTMTRTLTTNTAGAGTATLGGDSRLIFNGALAILSVNGNTTANAPLTFGASSTANIAAARTLRLNGGNLSTTVNQLEGGAVNGPGTLAANSGRTLRGFGTIAAPIDFDGTASLLADNGTLTINGAIADVGAIGTFDADGTLHVTNAWNNNVSTGVQLNGGVLSGGTITNDVAAGITGHGFVTARVINNTQLFASIADSLIFQTAGNDNDWDGTTDTGEIEAVSANIELRDNATFGFTGTVRASNGHTAFANGFALDFNPGSTLELNGGTYESTSSTDLGGTVTIAAGPQSTIKVKNNSFLSFEATSTTTLTGNLQLENNNIIVDAGATFAGGGALIIPDGSHLVADNLSNIGVLLDMQGAFRPGNFNGIGRVDLFDYQQGNPGELYVELTGTALNAFDRLVASGDVVLDGYLNIDIDEISPGVPFVPSLGQTFNIITGNTVTGTFDYADVSGMPAGLAFHINYLANAVQLQVVNKPIFSADFDDDGDVDPTDLAIWKGAFDLNQLGDADGDNDSDGADFLLWQQQYGSAPAVAVAQPASAAVPEPSAAALLLTAMVGVGWRRSRAPWRA